VDEWDQGLGRKDQGLGKEMTGNKNREELGLWIGTSDKWTKDWGSKGGLGIDGTRD
jgi:hypothetical protein